MQFHLQLGVNHLISGVNTPHTRSIDQLSGRFTQFTVRISQFFNADLAFGSEGPSPSYVRTARTLLLLGLRPRRRRVLAPLSFNYLRLAPSSRVVVDYVSSYPRLGRSAREIWKYEPIGRQASLCPRPTPSCATRAPRGITEVRTGPSQVRAIATK